MIINLIFDTNALAAPASFRTAVQAAANILDAAITQNVTINIEVGYGENPLFGPLSPQTSADGGPAGSQDVSYSSIRTDLIANATAGDTTFNFLPAGSSIQGQSQVVVWDAQLKALGLLGVNRAVDGSIGIGTQVPQASLVGVALHELTHAMGRVENAPKPDIMDFFRFASPGNLLPFNDSIPGPASYFSVNNGAIVLANYGRNSDPSDFLNAPASKLTPLDPFNEFYGTGTHQNLTVADLKQLDALGFDIAPALLQTAVPTVISLSGASDSSISPVVAGHTVTITVGLNETVTVAGAPTLLLNDNELANYVSGSGTSALTFSYVVQTADVVSDLKVTSLDLSGSASITDSNGSPLINVAGDLGLNIHGLPDPTVVSLSAASDSSISPVVAGHAVTITVGLNEAVTVAGAPTLLLNDNELANYVSGSGTSALTFSYVVQTGDVVSDLKVTSLDLQGGSASITNSNGIPLTNVAGDLGLNIHGYPEIPGNVDEWILSNGQWIASAGPGSHPTGSQVAGVGDFTGNGTSDILWFNSSTGDVDVWKMSDAAWNGSVNLGSHPGNFQIAGVGDFNGDGIADVLWTNSSSGGVQTDIWELQNGQWSASVSPGTHPGGYQVVGVGDFNGNGTSDILWQNPTTGDVDEWQIANGKWAASVDLGPHPGSGWKIAGVGDFNGDGRSDILWANSSNGQVQTDIWELGSNGKWINSVSAGSHPAGYQVVGVGDITDKGTSDILWQNPTTGDVDEWVIANGHWSASIDLGSHPGTFQVAGVGDFTGSGTHDILWHM